MKRSKKTKRKGHFSLFDALVKISITSFCLLFILFNVISLGYAAGIADAFKTGDKDPLKEAAKETGYNISQQADEPIGFMSPLFNNLISALLGFLGLVFILLMIYGGYLWMSDTGNEEQVKKAKDLITAAIIGLVIVLASYAISYLVVSVFSSRTLQ
ncbi:hypothetical protein GF382_03870 [Candidatus Falkowbacteria bacterium]|nr:hypothetical protein [Candidatus Falkowbacteria bacterium]